MMWVENQCALCCCGCVALVYQPPMVAVVWLAPASVAPCIVIGPSIGCRLVGGVLMMCNMVVASCLICLLALPAVFVALSQA